MIDEFAPLVDSMLRAEILMKAAVIHERLAHEYGFTGNYQRTKLYVQEARSEIAEELGITPNELAGMHRRFEVTPAPTPRWTGATRARPRPHGHPDGLLLPHGAGVVVAAVTEHDVGGGPEAGRVCPHGRHCLEQ